jgi:type IV secretion system protein VirB4
MAGMVRRDPPAARHIPYTAHVSPYVLATKFGDFVQAIRLSGAAFETADDVEINVWHEQLNMLWRSIASAHVSIWTHLIRRRDESYPDGSFPSAFATDLDHLYRQRIAGERLMRNELYVALVYRPTIDAASGITAKILTRAPGYPNGLAIKDALDACEKLSEIVLAGLVRYEPERLGVYRQDSQHRSQLLEYLGVLINAERQSMTLPRAPLDEVLATSRILCGYETIEYRTPTQTRLGAILGIRDYATPTVTGMLNGLLAAPFPFVLTQSFTMLSKATSEGLLQRQYNRMCNAGDFAVSQAEELKEALDALASNEFVLGDHHLSLQVLTDPYSGVDILQLKTLNERIALARGLLSDIGLTVAREDLALEASFWAQLPGQFRLRPRKAPITSRNFAAMAPLLNYPTGRANGNHWGAATTVLMTQARSPFFFSLHASDVGHTLICGPTGSGKTVLIGFLIAMLTKQGVTQVVIDRDRGLEGLVRALDGEYLSLRNGLPTGFNPLQLPNSPDHEEFLKVWLRVLGRAPTGAAMTVREESDLDQALRGVLTLEPSARRLSRLIEFLDRTDAEGLYARLARWCYSTGGEYAWVFDNPSDLIVPRLGTQALIGFDYTDFLDHPTTRIPVTQYLLHLISGLLDGRRLVCWMDEFSQLLSDPVFAPFAKVSLQTWRKLNGVFCAATQMASDVTTSTISRAIVEQTATKVFFPNVEASRDVYLNGFNLNERELELIQKGIQPGSRSFLVKQGDRVSSANWILKGLTTHLP